MPNKLFWQSDCLSNLAILYGLCILDSNFLYWLLLYGGYLISIAYFSFPFFLVCLKHPSYRLNMKSSVSKEKQYPATRAFHFHCMKSLFDRWGFVQRRSRDRPNFILGIFEYSGAMDNISSKIILLNDHYVKEPYRLITITSNNNFVEWPFCRCDTSSKIIIKTLQVQRFV